MNKHVTHDLCYVVLEIDKITSADTTYTQEKHITGIWHTYEDAELYIKDISTDMNISDADDPWYFVIVRYTFKFPTNGKYVATYTWEGIKYSALWKVPDYFKIFPIPHSVNVDQEADLGPYV